MSFDGQTASTLDVIDIEFPSPPRRPRRPRSVKGASTIEAESYNGARRYVRNKAPMFSFRDDEHWRVWKWFSEEPGQAPQVATLGQALHSTRNKADYNVYGSIQNLKHEVATAVQKAGKILSLLESLRS